MTRANTESYIAESIREKTHGAIRYLSGYKNKDSKIKVACVNCGCVFTQTYHHIHVFGCKCPRCRENAMREGIERREAAKAEELEARIQRAKKKRRDRVISLNDHGQMELGFCPVCGELVFNRKYCSAECRSKANNAAGELRRRNLISKQMVDADITVEGLFRRDNGICYLCGKRCNFEDYTIRDGVFIAGDYYPSIDHVVPLAKGGEHSWNNVRLAHRICNSIKGSRTDGEGVLE